MAHKRLRLGRLAAGGLILAAFGMYVWVITRYPVIYWDDPYVRLAYRDWLFVSPWLPGLQVIIFAVSRVTTEIAALRVVLALIACMGLASAYAYTAQIFRSPAAGLIAAALLGSSPIILALATVPYTEILFITLVLIGLTLYDRRRHPAERWIGIAAINLACLTRYEAWPLALILAGEVFVRERRSSGWKTALRRGLIEWALLAAAQPAWLGAEAVGAYVSEAARFAQGGEGRVMAAAGAYFTMFGWQAGAPVIALGAVGLALPGQRRQAIRWGILLAVLFVPTILINPLDNLRQTFVALVGWTIFAAGGLDWAARWAARLLQGSRLQAVGLIGVTAALAWVGLASGAGFVAQSASRADLVRSYTIGAWMRAWAAPGESILVVSGDSQEPYRLAAYTSLPLDRFQALPAAWPRHETAGDYIRGEGVRLVAVIGPGGADAPPTRAELLAELGSGSIGAVRVEVGGAEVWVMEEGP